jgi:hypothetical protein
MKLIPVNWNKRPAHAHYFEVVIISGKPEEQPGFINGFVFPINGSNTDHHQHFFRYSGPVTFGNYKIDVFNSFTEYPIELNESGHYHKIKGSFEYEGETYEFYGNTGNGLGYYPDSI